MYVKVIQYSSKKVINYINITKNQENDLQNTTQNLQNDPNGFACDFWLFCFAILKLEINKIIRTQKTLKHWPIPKTHLKPLDLPNLIKFSGPGTNFEVWPKIDQV